MKITDKAIKIVAIIAIFKVSYRVIEALLTKEAINVDTNKLNVIKMTAKNIKVLASAVRLKSNTDTHKAE